MSSALSSTQQEQNCFQDLLSQKELKFTYERKTIFQEIQKISEHFDADSLYGRFKRKKLRISRDTVYRTLPLLLESGVIQKSAGVGKRDFYERTSARGHHDHLICIQCHKIVEFVSKEIEEIQNIIAEQHRFQLVFHDYRLFGTCGDCRRKK